MKIGNTVVVCKNEKTKGAISERVYPVVSDIDFGEGEELAIIGTVAVALVIFFYLFANQTVNNDKIRSSVETLYCLEHTDLSADECDRLF